MADTDTAKAPTVAIGYTHAPTFTWWLDENETTPELQFPQSVRVFDSMRRTDSQVTSVLQAVCLPVERTPWRIDPNGARDEVVQFVADDFGLPIAGQTEVRTPLRTKNRFSWNEHLRLALLMLPYGFSYFEQLYRVDDDGSRAHLAKLEFRPQMTIDRVEVATDGGLVYVQQCWTAQNSSPRPIPVDRLVAYVHRREGGNWLGQSILRPVYKNWLLKDRLLRVQAQTIERNGMGIPVYKGQDGATETDLAKGKAMATAWRSGEAAGSAVPFGADIELKGVSGTLPDAKPAVEYHDTQIARAVLAHFLNLGTQTGSWALGSTFADFFTLSLQTLAQQIASTTTQHVIEDLVDVNWGPDEPAPRLCFDEIGSRQAATAEALKSLVDAGILHPDEPLEGATRQFYGLPPADPATATPPPGGAPTATPDAPTQTGEYSVAASAVPHFDEASWIAAAAGVDTHPGGEELKRWWVYGAGAAKWATWTELYEHLRKYIKGSKKLKATVSKWYRLRYGHNPPRHHVAARRSVRANFNPAQHRDDHGRWSDGPDAWGLSEQALSTLTDNYGDILQADQWGDHEGGDGFGGWMSLHDDGTLVMSYRNGDDAVPMLDSGFLPSGDDWEGLASDLREAADAADDEDDEFEPLTLERRGDDVYSVAVEVDPEVGGSVTLEANADGFSVNGDEARDLAERIGTFVSHLDDYENGAYDDDAEPVTASRRRVQADAAFEGKHKRGHGGRFIKMIDRLAEALKEHRERGGKGDPFAKFDREQLRRAAVSQGIKLERREPRESIARKLREHLGDDSDQNPLAGLDVAALERDLREIHNAPKPKRSPAKPKAPAEPAAPPGPHYSADELDRARRDLADEWGLEQQSASALDPNFDGGPAPVFTDEQVRERAGKLRREAAEKRPDVRAIRRDAEAAYGKDVYAWPKDLREQVRDLEREEFMRGAQAIYESMRDPAERDRFAADTASVFQMIETGRRVSDSLAAAADQRRVDEARAARDPEFKDWLDEHKLRGLVLLTGGNPGPERPRPPEKPATPAIAPAAHQPSVIEGDIVDRPALPTPKPASPRATKLADRQSKAGQKAAGVGVRGPSKSAEARRKRIEDATNAALDEADRRDRAPSPHGEVVATRRLTGGLAAEAVELVTYADGSQAVRKRVTDLRHPETKQLIIDARHQADAEELGSLVAEALGVAAPKVRRGDGGEILMDYMPGTVGAELDMRTAAEVRRITGEDQGLRLGLFDAVTDNADRNAGNWIVGDDGSVASIDHGFAWRFLEQPPGQAPRGSGPFVELVRGVSIRDGVAWKDSQLSPADIAVARGRLQALRPQFEALGRGDWLDASLQRLDALAPYAKGTRAVLA